MDIPEEDKNYINKRFDEINTDMHDMNKKYDKLSDKVNELDKNYSLQKAALDGLSKFPELITKLQQSIIEWSCENKGIKEDIKEMKQDIKEIKENDNINIPKSTKEIISGGLKKFGGYIITFIITALIFYASMKK